MGGGRVGSIGVERLGGEGEIAGVGVGALETRWQAVKIKKPTPERISRFLNTIPFSFSTTNNERIHLFAVQEIVHSQMGNGKWVSSLPSSQSIHKWLLYFRHRYTKGVQNERK
jgi:hypothetical protein